MPAAIGLRDSGDLLRTPCQHLIVEARRTQFPAVRMAGENDTILEENNLARYLAGSLQKIKSFPSRFGTVREMARQARQD